jgi:hypothetical protein
MRSSNGAVVRFRNVGHSIGTGERCNQASLHNRRQMGEQNGSVGNEPLKPAPTVTPPPRTRSPYGIAQIEPPATIYIGLAVDPV